MPHREIRRIVIDAGHGGKDFGAISPGGLKEKALTLEVAREVRDDLLAKGFHVIMTRNTDIFIPLKYRAKVANKKNADLFVSIHANASLTKSLKGFEVYYLSEAVDDYALAQERAENAGTFDFGLKTILWGFREAENRRQSIRLANAIGDSAQHGLPIEARRVRQAKFYVLKWTECPAVLVEMGYGTNRLDEKKLKNRHYRHKMADAISKGILAYKNEYDGVNRSTAEPAVQASERANMWGFCARFFNWAQKPHTQ